MNLQQFLKTKIQHLDYKAIATSAICVLTALVCILPMGLNPLWNGENPEHRNQYELLAESFLHGKVELDLPVDQKLLELEDPYDKEERDSKNVDYYWDHAFYDGHYYMYFGVVPVILLFLPFRLIAGCALTTYHATQIFVVLFIVGTFALFWRLYKKKMSNMPFSVFLLLCSSFSIMSIWYSIGCPALYCTAITSGLCFGIWSFYFYFLAIEDSDKKSFARRIFLILGAIFGASVFGCRPPIGLCNLIVIPVIVRLYKKRSTTKGFICDITCVILPYIVIGSMLMAYNYVRFDSVFEFGQSYQLTTADQTDYSYGNENLIVLPQRIFEYLFAIGNLQDQTFSGIFFNNPILVFSLFGFISSKSRSELHRMDIFPFLFTMAITVILIAAIDSLWSPYILERYRMDAYWICGIISFVILGAWSSSTKSHLLDATIILFSISTIWLSIIYLFMPVNAGLGTLFPDLSYAIRNVMTFGLLA